MIKSRKCFVVVVSTGGAVVNAVLHNDYVRSHVHSVVFDFARANTEKLQELGVRYEEFAKSEPEEFCDDLLDYVEANKVDYVLSYYTQFYSKKFRDTFRDRIINFHPSLLPAFKGMDGFGDAVAYHARLTGNTVEFIDEVMDEGKMIMQTVCPMNVREALSSTRHAVFIQQCKAVIQTVNWLAEDRISVDGRRIDIADASFGSYEFSPELDFADAIEFMPRTSMQPTDSKEN